MKTSICWRWLKNRKPTWTVLAILLGLGIHLWLGLSAIYAQSPTYDEPLRLTAGYAYWQTRDYRFNGYCHPPLSSMVAAIPLLFLDVDFPADHPLWQQAQWNSSNLLTFASYFYYTQKDQQHPDRLLYAGRCAMLTVSGLFCLFLGWAGRSLYGPVGGWSAFALAVFSPTLLAHGTLVTTDFLFAATYFSFFYCLGRWAQTPCRRWAIVSGITLGLTCCSKFSAIAIGPVVLLWLMLRRFRLPFSPGSLMFALGAFASTVLLVYQGGGVVTFLPGLEHNLSVVHRPYPAFLFGQQRDGGWWYYFPAVLLLKTPIPILLGLALSLGLLLRRKIKLPWFLLLPPGVYFLLACSSSLQIGHRHILPLEPFFYLLISAAVAFLWTYRKIRVLLLFLLVWLAVGTWRVSPFFLPYFHEAVGGPAHGYRTLIDSNTDWGQGLVELKKYMDRWGVKQIYLSYFGTARPMRYGIFYAAVDPARDDFDVDLQKEPRALLVLSVTYFQGATLGGKRLFGWLQERKPEAVLAGSLLVFDITADAQSHGQLADIFARLGKHRVAARELQWARELSNR